MVMKRELEEQIHNLVMSVADKTMTRERSFLPVTSMMELAPGVATLVARPQLPFRGDRLAVGVRCAPHFMILGIKVGNNYQGVQAGDIPADAFATRLDLLPILDANLNKEGFVDLKISKMAEDCFGQAIAMPCAQVGMEITFHVENISDKPLRFASVLLGDIEWPGTGIVGR